MSSILGLPSSVAAVVFVAALVVAYQALSLLRRRPARLPPGPPALPLLGNILEVIQRSSWVKFREYKDTYGDLVFFQGFSNKVLVLNSMSAIDDLLEKRANIYSDRPLLTAVGELMGLGQCMPYLPHNHEWKTQRKLVHQALTPRAVKQHYQIVHEDIAALLCKMMLETPSDFFQHVRLTSSRLVLAITYGLSVEKADDEYITQAEDTMLIIAKSTLPGEFFCDLVPAMKYLPSWLPFQRKARFGKEMIEEMVIKPFEHVKREMHTGTARPSLVRDLLSMPAEDGSFSEHSIKWGAGALYGAGGETTYTTVLACLLAMTLYPDKLKKVQEEIDRVVGMDRLPSFSDRDNLPYLGAVIKETMRWRPALPLSIPRSTSQEDLYKGYRIPKGTVVMPNVWAVAFEKMGPYDPEEFVPERFLVENKDDLPTDPYLYAFGFGRRMCPGKYLGERSLFILLSTIFWTFDISAPEGGLPEPQFQEELVRYPQPFECHIVPRTPNKASQVLWRAAQCTV